LDEEGGPEAMGADSSAIRSRNVYGVAMRSSRNAFAVEERPCIRE